VNDINETWQELCTKLGLDPQEVKTVSKRYDMYRSYTDQQGGNTLALPRWYKWYRIEKISEGHGMIAPPAQGCSVDANTESSGTVVSEQNFLQLLQLYRQ